MLWYSKEPSQWDDSFEHPKRVFKLMRKKIIKILRKKNFLIWSYDTESLPDATHYYWYETSLH